MWYAGQCICASLIHTCTHTKVAGLKLQTRLIRPSAHTNKILLCSFSPSTSVSVFPISLPKVLTLSSSPRHPDLAPSSAPPGDVPPDCPPALRDFYASFLFCVSLHQPHHAMAMVSRYGKIFISFNDCYGSSKQTTKINRRCCLVL